ncbi:hypothetical protein Ciccas_004668 [Cichlidogyrus casuarinus]|uniref:Ribosome biogenesis protein SLX9 n=1 Tax=Cichlidogyrus casuarinus TaxID=1844966 RepID=A0ABD2QAU6_9PLAT
MPPAKKSLKKRTASLNSTKEIPSELDDKILKNSDEKSSDFSPIRPTPLETIFEDPELDHIADFRAEDKRRTRAINKEKRKLFSKKPILRQSIFNEIDARTYSLPKVAGVAPPDMKQVIERRNQAIRSRERRIIRQKLRDSAGFSFNEELSTNIANILKHPSLFK